LSVGIVVEVVSVEAVTVAEIVVVGFGVCEEDSVRTEVGQFVVCEVVAVNLDSASVPFIYVDAILAISQTVVGENVVSYCAETA
jgi:hypothetical protein